MVCLVALAEVAVIVDVLTHPVVLLMTSHRRAVAVRGYVGIREHAGAEMGWVGGICISIRQGRAEVVVLLRRVIILCIGQRRRLHGRQTRCGRYDVHLEAPGALCAPTVTCFGLVADIFWHTVGIGALDEILDTVGLMALGHMAFRTVACVLVDDHGPKVAVVVVVVIMVRWVKGIVGHVSRGWSLGVRRLGVGGRSRIPGQGIRPDIGGINGAVL